ncbi:MAG: APC family permease [Steroidobacteraceae bacterium]
MTTANESDSGHQLKRQMRLRDLVLAQILTVVGSSWVGIAAGVGSAQFLVWLLAFTAFYTPMAVAVYFLNREMPLEGGLYSWARHSFGDAVGFMTAWNLWAYALSSIATILFQIPSEMSYMIGPAAARLPDSHLFVYPLLATIVALLTLSAVRGLGLGKWIHNVSGASVLVVFTLLIATPLWAWLHGARVHYAPFALHFPHTDAMSLSLVSQVLFAAAGLEYIAIMAGETHSPGRAIGRSVVIASPIILLMFVLGTAAVVSIHGTHPGTPINYVAPIPQTLSLALGGGPAAVVAKLAILLLQIRILGAASFLYTGATRLPMAAGWDHLIPAWFNELHPVYKTPVNSIYVTSGIIVAMLVLGSAGVHAAEAFGVLNDASDEFYGLAYLVMFLIPVCGALGVRSRLPRGVAVVCAIGVLTILFVLALNAYPFMSAVRPGRFAAKVIGTTLLVNAVGWVFYRSRRRAAAARVCSSTG